MTLLVRCSFLRQKVYSFDPLSVIKIRGFYISKSDFYAKTRTRIKNLPYLTLPYLTLESYQAKFHAHKSYIADKNS